MTFATLLAAAAEEGGHSAAAVMGETFIYGVIALVTFSVLALVLASYRNVANRHSHKAEAYTRAHGVPVPPTHGHGH